MFRALQFLVTQAEIADDGTHCPAPDFLTGAVDLETALRMMTIDAAYAMNMEEQVGSIEPGKWADLTVIESDPTTQPSDELWVNAVWATLIDGAMEASVGPTSLCDALAGDS